MGCGTEERGQPWTLDPSPIMLSSPRYRVQAGVSATWTLHSKLSHLSRVSISTQGANNPQFPRLIVFRVVPGLLFFFPFGVSSPIKFLCHFSTVLLILPFPFQICSLPPLCSSPVSAALCPALPKSCYAQARAQVLSFSSENLCLYYPTLLPMHRRTLNTYQNRELARV